MKRIISTPPQWSFQSFPGLRMAEKWLGQEITFAHILGGLSALGIHFELFYGYFSSFGSKEKSEYSRPVVEFINRNVFVPLRRHTRRPLADNGFSSPLKSENDETPNDGETIELIGAEDAKEETEGSVRDERKVDANSPKSRKLKFVKNHAKAIVGGKKRMIVKKVGKQIKEQVVMSVSDTRSSSPVKELIRSEPSLSNISQNAIELTADDSIAARQVVLGSDAGSVLTDDERNSTELDTGNIRSKARLF